jgi:hypothetical protein
VRLGTRLLLHAYILIRRISLLGTKSRIKESNISPAVIATLILNLKQHFYILSQDERVATSNAFFFSGGSTLRLKGGCYLGEGQVAPKKMPILV